MILPRAEAERLQMAFWERMYLMHSNDLYTCSELSDAGAREWWYRFGTGELPVRFQIKDWGKANVK